VRLEEVYSYFLASVNYGMSCNLANDEALMQIYPSILVDW